MRFLSVSSGCPLLFWVRTCTPVDHPAFFLVSYKQLLLREIRNAGVSSLPSAASCTSKSPGESCTFVPSCFLRGRCKQSHCVQEAVACLFLVCGLWSTHCGQYCGFLLDAYPVFNVANLLPSYLFPQKTFL